MFTGNVYSEYNNGVIVLRSTVDSDKGIYARRWRRGMREVGHNDIEVFNVDHNGHYNFTLEVTDGTGVKKLYDTSIVVNSIPVEVYEVAAPIIRQEYNVVVIDCNRSSASQSYELSFDDGTPRMTQDSPVFRFIPVNDFHGEMTLTIRNDKKIKNIKVPVSFSYERPEVTGHYDNLDGDCITLNMQGTHSTQDVVGYKFSTQDDIENHEKGTEYFSHTGSVELCFSSGSMKRITIQSFVLMGDGLKFSEPMLIRN